MPASGPADDRTSPCTALPCPLAAPQLSEELATVAAARDQLQAELDGLKTSQAANQKQAAAEQQQALARAAELEAQLQGSSEELQQKLAAAASVQQAAQAALRQQLAAEQQAAVSTLQSTHEQELLGLRSQVRGQAADLPCDEQLPAALLGQQSPSRTAATQTDPGPPHAP